MTTITTPYDAEIDACRDATVIFEIEAKREGYLRAKAEAQPLVAAAQAILRHPTASAGPGWVEITVPYDDWVAFRAAIAKFTQ